MSPRSQPARRRFLALVAAVGGACLSPLNAAASQKKTYKYRCPKCKLIQEYGTMGVKKCPNDGKTMIRVN